MGKLGKFIKNCVLNNIRKAALNKKNYFLHMDAPEIKAIVNVNKISFVTHTGKETKIVIGNYGIVCEDKDFKTYDWLGKMLMAGNYNRSANDEK